MRLKPEAPARTIAAAAALALPIAAVLLAPAPINAAPKEHEITVTIKTVKALDSIDTFSKGDFYARVTINGTVQKTAHVRQSAAISPNWKIVQKVPPGTHKIKVEILDKDASLDDPIDINRIDNKRDLDFTVNTKNCKIEGFASTYRCGKTITRGGNERKKAEAAFTVGVKK